MCDEYPFYSTAEGGPEDVPGMPNSPSHPRAHLKLVDAREQTDVQAHTLQNLYSDCSIRDVPSPNDDFFVIPEPAWPLTAWLCRNWGTASPGGIGGTP